MVNCPECTNEVVPAGVPGGGRVGWWCQTCEALYPDGDYVSMRSKSLYNPL